MQKRVNILFIAFVLLLLGCTKGLEGEGQDTGDTSRGTLQLSFAKAEQPSTPSFVLSNNISRATATVPAPPTEEFIIKLFNSAGENVLERLYGDMPISVKLDQGEYTITAEHGVDTIFSVEDRYYFAQKTFTIEAGYTTNVELVASIYGYIVDIVYNAEFASSFKNYHIEAELNAEPDTYIFAENGSNCRAYFAPGTARLLLKGELMDGRPYNSIIYEIDSPGKQLYTLNLKVAPKGHIFDIEIDAHVDEIMVENHIPGDLLPEMPAVPSSKFEYYETTDKNISSSTSILNLGGVIGLSSIELTFRGAQMAALGLTGTLSTANAKQFDLMVKAGIVFEKDLDKKLSDPFVHITRTKINFAPFAQKLLSYGGVATPYTVNVKTNDRLGKTAQNDITITIRPPVFSMSDVSLANIWTREFTFEPISQSDIAQGNYEVMMAQSPFRYQYSADGSTWSDVVQGKFRYEGLTPGTTHYLRVIYRDLVSESRVIKTGSVTPVPLGDLDNWTSTNPKKNQKCYFLGDGSQWATRNTLTCTTAGADKNFVSYSGTHPGGSYEGQGAEIFTCGWGSGNTNTFNGNLVWMSAINNITVGSLFLGSYDATTRVETHGIPFESRPNSFSFYYKYDSHSSDEMLVQARVENRRNGVTTILASGEYRSTASQGSFAQRTIELNYTVADMPATHMVLAFYSGKNENSKDYIKGGSGYWYGSRLYVDKLTFEYDK